MPSFNASDVTGFVKHVARGGEGSFLGFLEKTTDTYGRELDTFREHHTVRRVLMARVQHVP